MWSEKQINSMKKIGSLFYLHCKGNHVIWKLLISIIPSESLFVSWPYCLSDSSVNCHDTGQLSPTEKHYRVAFVPTGHKTMLLCCFIHIKLKSLWKDEARPNHLQSESWIGTDQSYPCSGGLIARDFKCQSTTLSWIMVFLWFPAIIWSKNRKLPRGL